MKKNSRCAGYMVKKSYRKKEYIFKNISRCAGYMVIEFGWPDFRYTNLKNEGDVMIKSDDFQRRNLSSVGRILGTQT